MRIAASTYLNSAPLVHSFSQGSLRHTYEFLGDTAPSRCAAMLAAGQCEIALIPAIEYQRIPGLRVIPDVAVASKKRVRSVLIAARCSLQDVKKVTLDTSSRTSQALVKILFERRYGSHPVFVERAPDFAADCENMLEGSDAALVIGDPAMRLAASAGQLGVRIYDLAEEWRLMTGLPFVFAVWAVRADVVHERGVIERDFLTAKREGLARLEQLATEYAAELRLPQPDLLTYLQDSVNYDLDAENIAGMERYFDLAAECGLIPQRRPVEFLHHKLFAEAGKT
ncbi:MAG TPA: menaquinone biosynthesis protein [Blastocatellia bacterium]|nr:menaquinone biosynthesis protein [Blastocatellia bacterium]